LRSPSPEPRASPIDSRPCPVLLWGTMKSTAHRYGIHRLHRTTGISVSHISKIFNGRRLPSLVAAKKISSALGVSLDTLYAEIRKQAA